MRTKRCFLWLCLIGSFLLGACNKLDHGHHVEPITLYEKLSGSWMLTNVTQIDETAKLAKLKPDELSLYNQFDFSTFSITFDVDDANQPTSYRVGGDAPTLFPKEGFWDLDQEFPRADGIAPVIRLYENADKKKLTGKLNVTAIPGATPQMELKLTRTNADVAFISYVYQLTNLNIQ